MRPRLLLAKSGMDALIARLAADGWEVIGPRVEAGAIALGPIARAADLPIGVGVEQSPGRERLVARGDRAWFAFAVGAQGWKRFVLPPELPLVAASRGGDGLAPTAAAPPPPRRAFVGVRPCELAALACQDRVLADPAAAAIDPWYAAARARLLVVVVECDVPGGACFCASMGTGPDVDDAAAGAADVVCTELDDAFVVRVGTPRGAALASALAWPPAPADAVAAASARMAAARAAMERHVDTDGLPALLHRNQEHPRWDVVAGRCLGCTSCTLVCPTCFCTGVDDETDLLADGVTRVRRWDSCFAAGFARVHGGSFRSSLRARYRQWLTHKFASWWDQFGGAGCVGCGRCITWCPAGIDVTEEIAAIRATDGARAEACP